MDNSFSKYRAENFEQYEWLCDRLLAEWIIRMVKPYGDSIIDIGCGNGFMLPYYDDTFKYIAAVEPNRTLYKLAKEKSSHAIIRNGVAENIPFEECSYDIAISKSSLHHFADFNKGLQEMQRVARNALAVLEVVSPTKACMPFLETLLTTKERGRKVSSVFSNYSIQKIIEESIGTIPLLQLYFDQYIDVEKWLQFSDLSIELQHELFQFIISVEKTVVNDMQIHYRNGHLIMLRRMCLSIGMLS